MSAFIPYPDWICSECGDRYGRGWPKGHSATFHAGRCGVCNKETTVTEPRDYGHLREGWRDHLAGVRKGIESKEGA